MERFKRKLNEQIQFLRTSADIYDQGNTSEALRIAVSLRVIFYSTGNSTSIIKHMGTTNLNLLSTGGVRVQDAQNMAMYYGLGYFHLSNEPTNCYRPSLGDGPTINKFLPLKDWWDECVYVLEPGKYITRKKIMLGAANNDGGAHVDEALEELYASLAKNSALGTVEIFNDKFDTTVKHEISNANHVALRQMAYEVLNSPEFIALSM